MGNIVLLDDLTINKIAAGEVIERPASVIKEMVENSIDAGATNINVEIRNGGISYIRITDNGKGISPDDMELAFERHATSKIRSADDLNTIKSMGFRGEALASIAAIANVEMVSKTKDLEVGNKIVVEAGKVLKMEETGCQTGTTITVQNLFFNTPVRYKFLKKDYTESGYIEDVITRLALINPGIAFKLVNSGKTIIQTSGSNDIKDVIYAIYGKDIASSVLNVDYTYEDIHITGVVGKPEIARSNRGNQLFFVNKRYVKDKTLSSAAENSFKGLLPIGRYGFLILNVDLDSSKVDVNVHPAKLEVRFEEESKVFKAVYHSIKDTLLKAELIENVQEDKGSNADTTLKEDNKIAEKSGITELFKKIINKQEKEEKLEKDNLIEQIYNKDKKIEEVTPTEEKIIDYNTPEDKKRDMFEELMNLQRKLKEEAENNNIETNIDNIIEQTNSIKDNEANNINEQENKEEIEQTISTNEEEKQEEYKETDNEETSKDIENIDETKAFSTDELNELIEKMENEDISKDNPEFVDMYQKIFGKLPASVEEKQKEEEKKINAYDIIKDNNISVFEEIEEYNKPTYKFIGIVFNTYIIIEIGNEMYILDQHAAHERIMYEKVKENYYSNTDKDSQMLLLPDIITLTHKEMDIARENYEMFEKAGFVLEEFGENTIKLSGVPNICLDLDTKELFLETLDEINTVAVTAKQEIEERFIATVACKAAVKANMVLTKEEVDKLMNDLLKLPNPFTCPHGRPTAIKMDKQDIEKKFARRK